MGNISNQWQWETFPVNGTGKNFHPKNAAGSTPEKYPLTTASLHLHLLSMDDRRHHLPGAPYPCCGLPPPPPPKPPDGGGGGPPPPGGAACGASAAISSLREYRPSAREQSTLNHLKRFPFQSKKLRKYRLCTLHHHTILICQVLPVTDEVLLVEDGPVGAEEGVGDQAAVNVPQGAEVECLALCLGVGILASLHLPITAESCVGHLGIDGEVLPCHPRNGLTQVTTASKNCSTGTASSS